MGHKLKIDFWLLAPALVLVILGLTTLSSISHQYLQSQLGTLLVALILFIFFSQFNFKLFKYLKLPLYISALFFLTIVFFIGIESRGAVRWMEFFGVRVQFSEIFKPLLSLALAAQLFTIHPPTFKKYMLLLILLAPVAILIHLQPDLGNAIIYVGAFFGALIVMGYPLRWVGITLLPFLLASPYIWSMLHEYQRQRILTLLDPFQDPLGTSYNSIQALIAVGSGKIFGKGLGEGTQSGLQFLPERHTDFIFAALSEGLGFTGGLLVIMAFSVLLYRLYKIFTLTEGIYEKTFIACAFFFILIQFLFNIGMNVNLLPVVGITLPFMSFGGSSLVANFLLLGIASSISISIKKKHVLEIR